MADDETMADTHPLLLCRICEQMVANLPIHSQTCLLIAEEEEAAGSVDLQLIQQLRTLRPHIEALESYLESQQDPSKRAYTLARQQVSLLRLVSDAIIQLGINDEAISYDDAISSSSMAIDVLMSHADKMDLSIVTQIELRPLMLRTCNLLESKMQALLRAKTLAAQTAAASGESRNPENSIWVSRAQAQGHALTPPTPGGASASGIHDDNPLASLPTLPLPSPTPPTTTSSPPLAVSKLKQQARRPGHVRRSSTMGVPTIREFKILDRISAGAYGRVYLARKRVTGDLFAIKVIKKKDLERKNQLRYARTERDILSDIADAPFLVTLYYAFQSKRNLYLVMEYLNGGDTLALLSVFGRLEEDHARQYVAEVVVALEYLHGHGIVHRDLKPENLLVASNGHLKLVDFGLSFKGMMVDHPLHAASSPGAHDETASPLLPPGPDGRHDSSVGTPDYLAPEVILGVGHSAEVDWWALGCVAFEYLDGEPPFRDESVEALFANVVERNIVNGWPDSPEEISEEARDLIDKLLVLQPEARLGARGAREVKAHPWFRGIPWDTIHEIPAPFIPNPDTDVDLSYHEDRSRSTLDEAELREVAEDDDIHHDILEKLRPPSSSSLSSPSTSPAKKPPQKPPHEPAKATRGGPKYSAFGNFSFGGGNSESTTNEGGGGEGSAVEGGSADGLDVPSSLAKRTVSPTSSPSVLRMREDLDAEVADDAVDYEGLELDLSEFNTVNKRALLKRNNEVVAAASPAHSRSHSRAASQTFPSIPPSPMTPHSPSVLSSDLHDRLLVVQRVQRESSAESDE